MQIQNQNEQMEKRISGRREEHQSLFQNTLKVISARVEEHQKDKSESNQIQQLQKQIISEKETIEKINKEIDAQEKKIKEVHLNYKE